MDFIGVAEAVDKAVEHNGRNVTTDDFVVEHEDVGAHALRGVFVVEDLVSVARASFLLMLCEVEALISLDVVIFFVCRIKLGWNRDG